MSFSSADVSGCTQSINCVCNAHSHELIKHNYCQEDTHEQMCRKSAKESTLAYCGVR